MFVLFVCKYRWTEGRNLRLRHTESYFSPFNGNLCSFSHQQVICLYRFLIWPILILFNCHWNLEIIANAFFFKDYYVVKPVKFLVRCPIHELYCMWNSCIPAHLTKKFISQPSLDKTFKKQMSVSCAMHHLRHPEGMWYRNVREVTSRRSNLEEPELYCNI